MSISRPEYRCRQIGTEHALSWVLGFPAHELRDVAAKADHSYRLSGRETKPDGSVRETYDAFKRLKAIQDRINRRILGNVWFPHYLQGSIRDTESPRSYLRDAGIHIKAKTIITEDVKNFFPSITEAEVRDIWLRFFCFSQVCAELLTKLTTRQGVLAQGAKTSSGLANLVFWRTEPELVDRLQARGLRYSRYVDDVNVSSTKRLTDTEVKYVVSNVIAMFGRHGCRPNRNRDKHRIAHEGRALTIHRLPVHSSSPRVGKKERRRVRSAVHELEQKMAEEACSTDSIAKLKQSTTARIQRMAELQCPEAGRLMERVRCLQIP